MNAPIMYFAYGSNMNPERMGKRCPGATVIGVALLRGYRLSERLYADIDPEPGGAVHGVLYAITAEHLKSLDLCEGCPRTYRRMTVDVECSGKIYPALVYEMTPETKAERNGIPYPEDYRECCSAGARFHHIEDGFFATVGIIVYGTLMTGEVNHTLCRNALAVCPCTIRGTLYDTGWGFPAFEPGEAGTVRAEFIEIPASDLPALDRLEGYPRLYDRRKISAVLEDGTTVEAWVYVMNDLPQQAVVITGGSWKNRT